MPPNSLVCALTNKKMFLFISLITIYITYFKSLIYIPNSIVLNIDLFVAYKKVKNRLKFIKKYLNHLSTSDLNVRSSNFDTKIICFHFFICIYMSISFSISLPLPLTQSHKQTHTQTQTTFSSWSSLITRSSHFCVIK